MKRTLIARNENGLVMLSKKIEISDKKPDEAICKTVEKIRLKINTGLNAINHEEIASISIGMNGWFMKNVVVTLLIDAEEDKITTQKIVSMIANSNIGA